MNSLSPHQKSSVHWTALITAMFVIFVLIEVFIGALWVIRYISNIPQYGDTVEYLKLSKDLMVDQYRGIFYP